MTEARAENDYTAYKGWLERAFRESGKLKHDLMRLFKDAFNTITRSEDDMKMKLDKLTDLILRIRGYVTNTLKKNIGSLRDAITGERLMDDLKNLKRSSYKPSPDLAYDLWKMIGLQKIVEERPENYLGNANMTSGNTMASHASSAVQRVVDSRHRSNPY